jgi:type IV pilus assembly protein PilA
MKRFMRGIRHGEKGFTLIELLIVVAILGVLAAVVIPNVGSFMGSARVNAGNTELQNIRTAAIAFMADNNGVWPTSGTDLTSGANPYLNGTLVGTYTINKDTGVVTGTAYPGCHWDSTLGGQWLKGETP